MKKTIKNERVSDFFVENGELVDREELYSDVRRLYANKHDAMLVEKNKKRKLGSKFWKKVSDEEFLAALALITPPEKILIPEDVEKAGVYLKTHKKFRKAFKKAMKDVKKVEKSVKTLTAKTHAS